MTNLENIKNIFEKTPHIIVRNLWCCNECPVLGTCMKDRHNAKTVVPNNKLTTEQIEQICCKNITEWLNSEVSGE